MAPFLDNVFLSDYDEENSSDPSLNNEVKSSQLYVVLLVTNVIFTNKMNMRTLNFRGNIYKSTSMFAIKLISAGRLILVVLLASHHHGVLKNPSLDNFQRVS